MLVFVDVSAAMGYLFAYLLLAISSYLNAEPHCLPYVIIAAAALAHTGTLLYRLWRRRAQVAEGDPS